MYQFTGKLKIFALALMVLGVLGTVYNFATTPKNFQEVEKILNDQAAHHGGHGTAHAAPEHKEEAHEEAAHKEETHKEEARHETAAHDTKEEHADVAHDSTKVAETAHAEAATTEHAADTTAAAHHTEDAHATADKAEVKHAAVAAHATHDDAHEKHVEHVEHVMHQMQNRPWSAFYVAMLFFLGISLLVMAFYAAQRVAHAGWSVVLFRVMEAITNNIHYVSAIMVVFIILTAMHMNHLFPWMGEGVVDPLSDNYDPIIDRKSWWMNVPGWTIRSIFYIAVWNALRFIIRKKSIQQDNGDLKLHKQIYNMSVGFAAFFMVSESMMSWDWIMGIDPHWFSTLFGWYVLATLLVSALTVIALVTIYLRSKGALPFVNDSHIHDLAKFMFGFSVFWTYLWFAQFMLIWYADMPEETTYYAQRFNEYQLPFIGMVVLNFIFPVLLLINSDFKSIPWLVILGGVVILIGHYIDLFVMIMPGTVGGQWGFGIGELSAILFFIGLFIFATFSAFAKAAPLAKGNPFIHESETHHYYNIEHRGEDSNHH